MPPAGSSPSPARSWRVEPDPLPLTAARWAGWGAQVAALVVAGLLEAVGGSGGGGSGDWPQRPRRRPAAPADPSTGDTPDAAATVVVTGTAPWMPSTALGPQLVEVGPDGARRPTGHGAAGVLVPLDGLVVVAARHRRGRARRHATARWELRVAGPATDVVVRGEWLALACLGHLAGWPEPVPGSGTGCHLSLRRHPSTRPTPRRRPPSTRAR